MTAAPLQEAAAALLRQATELPARDPGEPLRPTDELRILVMVREQGCSQQEAAAVVGCNQSTVSRVLAKYDDTRPLARKRLEAAALDLAEKAIKEGDPLKILAKLDVVRDDKAGPDHSGVVINIGTAEKPIALPDIVVTPVETVTGTNGADV